MRILAIDPGPFESAYALIDADTCRPIHYGKLRNASVLDILHNSDANLFAVEMIASYGMAVGAEVFETCVWIGRFYETIRRDSDMAKPPDLVKRPAIKLHHCYSAARSF